MPIKKIGRRPLSFLEKTYLPQIFIGLKITLKNFFRPAVTLQYPEERPDIPEGYRGVPTLVKDANGREKCVACQLCEFVCPPKAIRILPRELESDGEDAHVEKGPEAFDIDMLRCIYCGYCQEVCPEEAIWLQDIFSISGYSREAMVFDKEKLYQLGGTLPDNHFKWDKKKAAEEAGNRL